MANAYRERLAHLKQFIRGVKPAGGGGGLCHESFGDRLTPCGAKSQWSGSGFFAAAARQLAVLNNAGEAWQRTLKDFQGKLTLTETDWACLAELSALLGVTDQANQIRAIRENVARLEAVVQESQEKVKVNERVLRYAGFILGMILVLVLY